MPGLRETIGVYDTTVLDHLDATLSRLYANGVKAIFSPHNAGQIDGTNGCDAHCQKYWSRTSFYTSAAGVANYDDHFTDLNRALRCEAFDIVSVHRYMSKLTDWAYFISSRGLPRSWGGQRLLARATRS